MAHTLTARDKANLRGVHADLVKVVYRLAEITTIPFRVNEGLRSVAQQKENVAKGVSKTMNSRHLTGHAIDLIPMVGGKPTFAWPVYFQFEPLVLQAAKDVGVPIEWGGRWKGLKDGPHWQLPWGKYPAPKTVGLLTAQRDPEMGGETDASAALKASGALAVGASSGGGLAADPLATLVDNLSVQQYALSSGDVVQLTIAVVIIGLSCWYAYKTAKG